MGSVAAPAALGGHPETVAHRVARGVHAAPIALDVPVVDQPEVETRALGQAQLAQRGEVRGVVALARHRQVDEVERPPARAKMARVSSASTPRRRHHQVLIGRAAVAEVIAELDVGGTAGPRRSSSAKIRAL